MAHQQGADKAQSRWKQQVWYLGAPPRQCHHVIDTYIVVQPIGQSVDFARPETLSSKMQQLAVSSTSPRGLDSCMHDWRIAAQLTATSVQQLTRSEMTANGLADSRIKIRYSSCLNCVFNVTT